MRAVRVAVIATAGVLELLGYRLRQRWQRGGVRGAGDHAIGAAAVCARAVSRRRLATVLGCNTCPRGVAFILAGLLIALAGCGDGDDVATSTDANAARSQAATAARGENPDGVTQIGGGRSLYVRCTGVGSPTVVMEGGDEDIGERSSAGAWPANVPDSTIPRRALSA